MKTLNQSKMIFSILAISVIMISVGSVSSHAYASVAPQLHQGTPKEPTTTMATHNAFLGMIKSLQEHLKTPIHMDLFSLAHKSSHV